MPKELTHWILAERALEGLPDDSRLRGVIHDHHRCYLAGAVLPDTLLHLQRGPYAAAALRLAERFHDTPGNSYAPLIAAERHYSGHIPPPLLACLLGVVTHMQADIVFHPLVYALAGRSGIAGHYRVETDMDIHFLCHGSAPPVRRFSDLLAPEVRPVLIDACRVLFDPDGLLPRQALEDALQLHGRFQGMYDRGFWKLTVRIAALLAGSPYREQRHLFYPPGMPRDVRFAGDTVEWRHPVSGEQQATTLEQLADTAIRHMLSTLEKLEKTGSLAVTLCSPPGENLLTGIHGACLNASGSGRHDDDVLPLGQELCMDPRSDESTQKELQKAQQELDRGNVLAALASLERALAIQDDPHWHSRLGFCIAKERGHLTRAFALCRSSIAHEPNNAVHYLYLGKVHMIAADQYEAMQALRQGMSQGGTEEIREMLTFMGVRKPPVIRVLSRKNPINKYLGRLLTRLGMR